MIVEESFTLEALRPDWEWRGSEDLAMLAQGFVRHFQAYVTCRSPVTCNLGERFMGETIDTSRL